MKTSQLPFWFILTGLLLGISWPHALGYSQVFPAGVFLIFFAFIPFLLAERYVYEKRLRPWRVVIFSYCAMVVFNFIATWWIVNASAGGMVLAVFVNALLMTFFIAVFHLVHRRLGHYWGYTAFVCLWMCYEYCHYHWELSWPWLNLGNAFASTTGWVQWYEYTGIGGGTLWILLVNLAGFQVVHRLKSGIAFKENIKPLATWVLAVALPILWSVVIYKNYEEKKAPIDVVVVQPNIDPYGDKFGNMTAEEQLIIFLRQAFMEADSTVDFIVGPETALPYSIEENSLKTSGEVELIQRAFARLQKTAVLIGMSSHRVYAKGSNMPDNARKYPDGTGVEFYNSALYLSPKGDYDVYHKAQLVLGVEKIPFAKWLPFMEDWALNMGGTTGTLGISEKPVVFEHNPSKVAPSICYESIYGDHMAAFVRDGANVLFVITNDGWWGDTPGYKQHFDYGRLTAISLRRSIAQSANTGISGFIDQRGDVVMHTGWWERTAIRQKINLNNELTFYARNGDLLMRVASIFAIAFLVIYLYAFFTGKNYVSRREV